MQRRKDCMNFLPLLEGAKVIVIDEGSSFIPCYPMYLTYMLITNTDYLVFYRIRGIACKNVNNWLDVYMVGERS